MLVQATPRWSSGLTRPDVTPYEIKVTYCRRDMKLFPSQRASPEGSIDQARSPTPPSPRDEFSRAPDAARASRSPSHYPPFACSRSNHRPRAVVSDNRPPHRRGGRKKSRAKIIRCEKSLARDKEKRARREQMWRE